MDITAHSRTGFTLMEMMVALLIVAILALMVVPVTGTFAVRDQVREALSMTDTLKTRIAAYYDQNAAFPADNADAGLPYPEQLIGNYVTRIDVRNGAVHILFGNKAHTRLRGKILSLQPLYVEGSPLSPVSWNCGYSHVPPGMTAAGENQSTVEERWLPVECRNVPYEGSPE